MKEFVVQNKFLCLALLIAVASVGFNVSQLREIESTNKHKELLRDKESLLQDGYNELMIGYIKEVRDQNLELARGQGRIEGVLSVINNYKPEQNLSSAVWHDGYYRGLKQSEDVIAANKALDELRNKESNPSSSTAHAKK